jgi:hypothetical protein
MCRQFSRIKFSQKTEARMNSSDKIPNEYKLIYRAPMTSYVNMAQATSSISIILLGVIGVYKYITDTTINFPFTFGMNEFNKLVGIHIDGEICILVSSFIIFNVGICAVTMRFPIRIYHHEGTSLYICILKGFLPLNTKKISFCTDEVRKHIPFMHSLLPWRNALFKIGKKTMFVMENNFRTPADFNTMFSKV